MEKLLNSLVKNTPLAVVVIGVLLVVIGAAGGLPQLSLKVAEPGWRFASGAAGTLVAGFGGFLILRAPSRSSNLAALAEGYGLKIFSPVNASDVKEYVGVFGTFKNRPPDKSVWIIERSLRSGVNSFKRRPLFDETDKRWSAPQCRLGGKTGEKRVLFVAVVGDSGQALADYYFKVGNETGQWPGIETLPLDIVPCDSIQVRRR
jgi:hypothetical protein